MTATFDPQRPLIISSNPAMDFAEGFPIGNGRCGVMCYGGPARLLFAVNHYDLYWRPAARSIRRKKFWPKVRRLFDEHRWEELHRTLNDTFKSWGRAELGSFQPGAIIEIALEFQDGATEYRRTLDYHRGITVTSFSIAREKWTVTASVDREMPLARIELHTTCRQGINARVRLLRPCDDRFDKPVVTGSADHLSLAMKFPDGMRYQVCARLRGARFDTGTLSLADHIPPAMGGHSAPSNHPDASRHANAQAAILGNARRASLIVAIDASASRRPAAFDLAKRTATTGTMPKALTRASIELHGDEADTFARRHRIGRYLFAASSFPRGWPPNLQGIWNDRTHPVCNSDWHLDLNLQAALWHISAGNLLEYHEPFFRLIESMLPGARRNARMIYNMRGAAFPITTVGRGEGIAYLDVWVGQSGWLMQHYWKHWRYTLDRAFLRDRCYPVLREVCQFYLDYLVDNGRRRVIYPSQSPENRIPKRHNSFHGLNSTFDLCVFHEVLSHTVEAARLLQLRDRVATEAEAALHRLAELPLAEDGRLREMEDYEFDKGHRHPSHLYPLYPGDRIVPEDRAMMRAAKLALQRFHSFPSTGTLPWLGRPGYDSWAGWTYPLLACLHARAGNGENALAMLQRYELAFNWPGGLAKCFESHDRGFGISEPHDVGKWIDMTGAMIVVAAVQEMLLQSHGGSIRLLPALPRAWKDGSFRGLRAEGGFEIDAEWRAGRIVRAAVQSDCGGPCVVRGRWIIRAAAVTAPRDCTGFITKPGIRYELKGTK